MPKLRHLRAVQSSTSVLAQIISTFDDVSPAGTSVRAPLSALGGPLHFEHVRTCDDKTHSCSYIVMSHTAHMNPPSARRRMPTIFSRHSKRRGIVARSHTCAPQSRKDYGATAEKCWHVYTYTCYAMSRTRTRRRNHINLS